MKKNFLVLLIAIVLMPIVVFAKDYNEFDIRFEQKLGDNVNDTEIKVYAMVDEEDKLKDHTEDFTMEDVKWYKYKSSMEDGKTIDDYDYTDEELNIYGYLVSDDDVYEEDYKYFLIISRLYAEEEDSFSRNVKINGVDIDELDGLCFNTGNEFFIKTVSNGTSAYHDEQDLVVMENPNEESNEVITTIAAPKTCMLGLSLCCTTFLGLSLCIWIIIAIIILLLIIIICVTKSKKRKE